MKYFPLLIAAAFPAFTLAQEPPAEKTEPAKPGLELAPLPEPPPPPPESNLPAGRAKPGEASPSLVPENIPPGARPRYRQKSTQKPPTTSADLDARIRFRVAYGKAVRDPKVQALWEDSRRVLTDYDKREAMRRYYTALFKRISAPDKVLAAMVAERQRIAFRKLEQNRIEPTDPLNDDHHNH